MVSFTNCININNRNTCKTDNKMHYVISDVVLIALIFYIRSDVSYAQVLECLKFSKSHRAKLRESHRHIGQLDPKITCLPNIRCKNIALNIQSLDKLSNKALVYKQTKHYSKSITSIPIIFLR